MPWFDPNESYNATVHHVKNAIRQKMADPDGPAVPPIHDELSKYWNPPEQVLARLEPSLSRWADSLNIVKGRSGKISPISAVFISLSLSSDLTAGCLSAPQAQMRVVLAQNK